jgi:predicted N-acyltransferase
MHLALYRDNELVAFSPAYLKGNSEGEFVFDYAFARFCEESLRKKYYPKLVLAVPFTPATGTRLLLRSGESKASSVAVLAEAARKVCGDLNLSSAHVLFPPEQESELWVGAGLARRLGIQYQWHNAGYASFDDFLSRFNAKRRHQIRRERRQVSAQGVALEVLTGSDLTPELADFVFAFYCATVDKFQWGRRYLNRAFFEEVLLKLRDKIQLVVAKKNGRLIAGAFNMLGSETLFGRYWGALEEHEFLHFEVCFYRGIEEAIRHGARRFEPGAGGEHKLTRGFEPTPTFSAHHFADRRLEAPVRDYLRREEAVLRGELVSARENAVLRPILPERSATGPED